MHRILYDSLSRASRINVGVHVSQSGAEVGIRCAACTLGALQTAAPACIRYRIRRKGASSCFAMYCRAGCSDKPCLAETRSGQDLMSCGQMQEVRRPTSGKDMSPVVLFAGEATHMHHFGTVHGACFTGEREAHRILDRYLKGACNT